MKKFLLAALLAGAAAAIPGSLYAEPHQQGGHPGGGGGGRPEPAMHAPRPAVHAPVSHYRPMMSHPTSHYSSHRPITHYHGPTTHSVHHHITVHTAHVIHHGHPTVVGRGHGNPRVASLRHNIRAVHRFHAGAYRAPFGYHYRQWGYGEFLPAVYWGHDYWLADFLAYGLFAPPDGYVWVRYGPDALLIDEYTGEIIQADYDEFY